MNARTNPRLALSCLTALSWLCLTDTSLAQNVVYVEEDWQLIVNQPDVGLNGPQVTCVIAPSTADQGYCAFDLNYHSQPVYAAGGLQMHVWNPYTPIVTSNFAVSGLMQTVGEVVTWTTTMSVSGGSLTFQVVNGQSSTWGAFGGTDDTTITVSSTASNLNQYDPNVSLDNSGVSFASNLVTSLTLTGVRFYDGHGNLVQQITTPQVVHPQN